MIVYLNPKQAQFKYNSEYEGGILCQDCDTSVIGKLEDYADKFLHGKFPNQATPRIELINGQECVVRENDPTYDYKRFKLFLLSMLWRASISSRPFFQQVRLGQKVQEDLRKMILEGKPGEPDEYACFICMPPLMPTPDGGRGLYTYDMPTMSPIIATTEGIEMCRFVIEGTHYFFIISKPLGSKILPGVERNKLTLGISTREEQSKLHQQMIEMMKNHPRKT